MAYKSAIVALLAFVCIAQIGAQPVQYPAFSWDGWDTIILDGPSYLFYIEHSYTDAQLYVFGGDWLRIINTANNFSVQDNYAVDWHQRFIGLHVFHNGTDLWAMGPTNPSDYSSHPDGYNLPLAVAGPQWHTLTVSGLQGFLLYNVFVDARNFSDILAYMVGWLPVTNDSVSTVGFGVVRLHFNMNLAFDQRGFTFNPEVDVLYLAYNSFSVYDPLYKPQIHYQNSTNQLIVVDPATRTIYTATVGPGTTQMIKGKAQLLSQLQFGHYITSSLFHYDTNLLYLGIAAQGTGNGSLLALSATSLDIQQQITFYGTLGNPRAIAIDEPTDTIYVGFNGGDAVVKLNYLLEIQGFQRVPDYLTKIEGARVGADHVYFITSEQHSKVARVRKQDFCPTNCPWFGYCDNGKCVCDPQLVMSKDGKQCDVPKAETKVEKGAATALGVLFALTFIAGALGWFLWWRSRKSGYVNV